MTDTSTDPTLINWERRQSKRAQDATLGALLAPFLLTKEEGAAVRMLSLPAAHWAFEQFLLATYPELRWEFVGLEEDYTVWRRMQRASLFVLNADGANAVCQAVRNTTSGYLDAHWYFPWDIVYFDYMGTWSAAKEKDVITLAQRQTPNVFACTISLSRGRPETNATVEYLSEVGKRHLEWIGDKTGRHQDQPHYKITGTPERILRLFEDNNWPMRMVGGFVYDSPSETNPSRTATEMTMVFQHKS